MVQPTSERPVVVFTREVAGLCPTRAEIDAGIVLAEAVVVGFMPRQTFVDASDGSSRMSKTEPGRIFMPRQPKVSYVGEEVAEGDEGYLLFLPKGDVEGYPLEKWPVVAFGRPEQRRGKVVRRTVTFAMPDAPTLNCVVPPAHAAAS